MKLSFLILCGSGLAYFASFLMHLFSFRDVKGVSDRFGLTLMRIGFLLATFFFVFEAVDTGALLSVLNMSKAMAFFAWALAFVYIVFLIQNQTDSFGLVLAPILLILTAVSIVTFSGDAALQDPAWSMESNAYFKMHIITAFFAYASFTLSFAASILYLVQNHELKLKRTGTFYHKLPALEELESLVSQPLFWGVPLLLLTVVIGFVWSKLAFGEYWVLDPKTIATIATGVLYAVILYLRYVSEFRGKRVAQLSLIAFSLVIFSMVGTRFIEGSHNYLQ